MVHQRRDIGRRRTTPRTTQCTCIDDRPAKPPRLFSAPAVRIFHGLWPILTAFLPVDGPVDGTRTLTRCAIHHADYACPHERKPVACKEVDAPTAVYHAVCGPRPPTTLSPSSATAPTTQHPGYGRTAFQPFLLCTLHVPPPRTASRSSETSLLLTWTVDASVSTAVSARMPRRSRMLCAAVALLAHCTSATTTTGLGTAATYQMPRRLLTTSNPGAQTKKPKTGSLTSLAPPQHLIRHVVAQDVEMRPEAARTPVVLPSICGASKHRRCATPLWLDAGSCSSSTLAMSPATKPAASQPCNHPASPPGSLRWGFAAGFGRRDTCADVAVPAESEREDARPGRACPPASGSQCAGGPAQSSVRAPLPAGPAAQTAARPRAALLHDLRGLGRGDQRRERRCEFVSPTPASPTRVPRGTYCTSRRTQVTPLSFRTRSSLHSYATRRRRLVRNPVGPGGGRCSRCV